MRRDNEPAFPGKGITNGVENGHVPGMTLRDYFAAAALPVCLKDLLRENGDSFKNQSAASWAYAIADAMISQRQE